MVPVSLVWILCISTFVIGVATGYYLKRNNNARIVPDIPKKNLGEQLMTEELIPWVVYKHGCEKMGKEIKKHFALGRFKIDFAIINPKEISDKKDSKQYQESANEFFKSLSNMIKIASEHPDISEKAYIEIFGKKLVKKND